MKANIRTDQDTLPFFDVRFIEERLQGEYDNVYLIFSTLEHEPTEAWEDQGDSFLLINLPKKKVLESDVDYHAEIIRHLPKLAWLEAESLLHFVNERWKVDDSEGA